MIILNNLNQIKVCSLTQKELAEQSGLSELSILRHLSYLETLHWIKINQDKSICVGDSDLFVLSLEEPTNALQNFVKATKLNPNDIITFFKVKYQQTYGSPYPLIYKKEIQNVHSILNFTDKKVEPVIDMLTFIFDNHEKIKNTTWLTNRITLSALTRPNIWAFLDQLKSEGFKTNNITDRYKENNSSEVGW